MFQVDKFDAAISNTTIALKDPSPKISNSGVFGREFSQFFFKKFCMI